MRPTSGVSALPVYATDSDYCTPPSSSERRKGVIPLDTLPAQWWNQMWNAITQQENNITSALNNIFSELNNVLAEVGDVGSATDLHQIQRAILSIHNRLATTTQQGTVKQNTERDGVTLDSEGKMVVTYMGDVADLTTPIKTTVVDAINSLSTSLYDIEEALRNKIDTMVSDATSNLENMITTCNACLQSYVDAQDSCCYSASQTYAKGCADCALSCAKAYSDRRRTNAWVSGSTLYICSRT